MTHVNPDGDVFTPKVTVMGMCREQIRQHADVDPKFDVHPCDIDGVSLGAHEALTIRLKHRKDGSVRGAEVIACVLKDEG